jgi:thiamine kinase-like enzyme
MRKQLSPQEIVEQYIEAGKVLTETTLNGDYKRGNKIAKELQKVFEKLGKNEDLAIQVLSQVMSSDIDKARSMAAADALRLNILVEQAIIVLEEVAKRSDIIGFGAETALKIWRGEYPGKTL